MNEATTISAALQADHERLDGILQEARKAAQGPSLDEAKSLFERFQAGLEHHIDIEERVLFPAFERSTGSASGPTHVMRMEHETIRQTLAEASAVVQQGDAAAFEKAAAAIEDLLSNHNVKEEQVLYPMTDQVLDRAEVADVVSQFPG